MAELLEFRPAMVEHRHVHGTQDAVRHRGRARDLQKMASGAALRLIGHGTLSLGIEHSGQHRLARLPSARPTGFLAPSRRLLQLREEITHSPAARNSHNNRRLLRNDHHRHVASARGPAQGGVAGRGAVRCLEPRALFDGRLDLSGRADRRGGAEDGGRCGDCRADRARGRRAAAAARRRHVAVRANRRPGAGHRLHEVPEPARLGGQGRGDVRGRAGHRARRAEPAAPADTGCGFRWMSRPRAAPPSAA